MSMAHHLVWYLTYMNYQSKTIVLDFATSTILEYGWLGLPRFSGHRKCRGVD
jgi:hypothetical protein